MASTGSLRNAPPESKTTGGLSQKVQLARFNDPKRTVRIRHLLRVTRQCRSGNLVAILFADALPLCPVKRQPTTCAIPEPFGHAMESCNLR